VKLLEETSLAEMQSRVSELEALSAEQGDPNAVKTEHGPLSTQLMNCIRGASGVAEVMAAYYSSITLLENCFLVEHHHVESLLSNLTKNAVIDDLMQRVASLQKTMQSKLGTDEYEKYKNVLSSALLQVRYRYTECGYVSAMSLRLKFNGRFNRI